MRAQEKKKILVVDDSRTVQQSVGGFLKEDYDVSFANNGQEGLTRAQTSAPDAIVSDLEMPQVDGLELLRRLRKDPRTEKIPVVIMTSVTAIDRVNACRSLGCNGYVLKPVQREYLLAKLRSLIAAVA